MPEQQETETDSFGLAEPLRTKQRALLIASGGGHWVQLARLKKAFDDCDTQYATTLSGVAAPSGERPVARIIDASRTEPLKFPLLLCQLIWIILRFRPHLVVSTGAGPGLIALRIGKFFGAKTVWIDSMANSETLSLSGRLAEPYADLWLTQWPHLTESNPRLKFLGRVIGDSKSFTK